jgi:hypothetical protein
VSKEMHTLYMAFPIEHSQSSIGCQSYTSTKLVMDRKLFSRIIFYATGPCYDLLRKCTSRYTWKVKDKRYCCPSLRLRTRQ